MSGRPATPRILGHDMMNNHIALLRRFRAASPLDQIPTCDVLSGHLAARIDEVGTAAFAEFAYLQGVAAKVWGPERTAHFARVLRDARISPKAQNRCPWQTAERLAGSLPFEWRAPLLEHITISRKEHAVLGRTIWSADYTKSVLAALGRWAAYCASLGHESVPTATSLHAYGCHLLRPNGNGQPTTTRTAADYLQRIMAGLSVATREHNYLHPQPVVSGARPELAAPPMSLEGTSRTLSQKLAPGRVSGLHNELERIYTHIYIYIYMCEYI